MLQLKWFLLAFVLTTAVTQGIVAYVHQVPTAVPQNRASARPSQVPVSRGASRETWEYRVEEYPADYPKTKGLQGWLNERGAQGWEVCSGSVYLSRFGFKRRNYRF